MISGHRNSSANAYLPGDDWARSECRENASQAYRLSVSTLAEIWRAKWPFAPEQRISLA